MTNVLLMRAAQASAAYQSAEAVSPNPAAGGGDFAGLLQGALSSGVSAGQLAEAKAQEAVRGSGDLTHVVTAVSRAELALQTTVAVRDRVLQAYQDIIKMPI